jgi:hypothetical protein
MAAVLASGPQALLSHRSAAHLWMIRPSSRTRIDVTVAHRSRSSNVIRRHVSSVPEDERTVEEGIPVTTVPRTILDLAAPSPPTPSRTSCARQNAAGSPTASRPPT